MALTVFYSWQSNTPAKCNRSFIEDALERAVKKLGNEPEIQESLREEGLMVDKDTKGVPGTPAIVDVIFEKISKCAVFVPDVTFVGATGDGVPLPNPNVLMEYGWALRSLGNSRIVPVMNSAYGEASPTALPFNMRHLRFPITYILPEGASDAEKQTARSELVIRLVERIGAVLKMVAHEETQQYEEIAPTTDSSTFLKEGEPLVVRTQGSIEQPVFLRQGARLFLRLLPNTRVEPIQSTQDALDLIKKGQLQPMRDEVGDASFGRNQYGAVIYDWYKQPGGLETPVMTQLFLTKEIWGVDAESAQPMEGRVKKVGFNFLPSSALERSFTATMSMYLAFASQVLALPLPLKFIAGATGIKGCRMALPSGYSAKFAGRMEQQEIVREGMVTDYAASSAYLLRPLFDLIWKECGLVRPDNDSIE